MTKHTNANICLPMHVYPFGRQGCCKISTIPKQRHFASNSLNTNFMRRLFPNVFGFIEKEMSDAVESSDILRAFMVRNEGSREKVMVLKKELVTGEDLRMANTPDGWG